MERAVLPEGDGPFWTVASPAIVVGAAVATAGLIVALRPTLARYALARPNARSSHRIPTPQGAGIAIVLVLSLVTLLVWAVRPELAPISMLATLLGAAGVLAVIGAADDIVTLRALPRLVCQLAATAAVVLTLPVALRALPWIPLEAERLVLILAIVWFVNLVNFMDGIDWITVAEVVPVCLGIALLGLLGHAPPITIVIALGLGGAMLGFAPFNRPVAKLFLGDVGSLPIGLLLGWLLVLVAGSGHLVAAILLPLYYLADATITLGRRLARGERVWEAHRSHFYQRATDGGFRVIEIVSRVFGVNVALVVLAISSAVSSSSVVSLAALALGAGLVGALLVAFVRGRR